MNKKLKSFLFCLLPAIMMFSFPVVALGITTTAYTPTAQTTLLTDIDELLEKVDAIVTYIYYALFIVAIVFIIFAAFKYLTAAGEQAKVKKASDQLIYAVVAIAVGLLAYSVTKIIENFLSK